MMRGWLARALQRNWYSDRRPAPIWRALAGIYGRISSARPTRPAIRPPCPVIVVGNLTAGGGGKTPVVAALAAALQNAGHQVAIVSRGYGGAHRGAPIRVEPDADPRQVGDEPLELVARTQAPVWICRQRRRALEAAIADGAAVVFSDDGLQHRELPRSFEICVVDGRRGFGNGLLLPAGPLRQPLARLDKVDLVLRKGEDRVGGLPGLPFALHSGGPVDVDGRELAPTAIDAIAGIADPESFFEMLENKGFRVRRHPLADHQPIASDWLKRLPGPVVVTAKDRMRMRQPARADLYVLSVHAELPARAIEAVRAHVREFAL